MHRWKIKATYRINDGEMSRFKVVEELDEVANFIELGPHWDTIIDIKITRFEPSTLTVEQAEQL